jgi:hypothetical protein
MNALWDSATVASRSGLRPHLGSAATRRFGMDIAALLVYFIDDEGNLDADVIGINDGSHVPPPLKSPRAAKSSCRVQPEEEEDHRELLRDIGLHLGIWPYPIADHVKG